MQRKYKANWALHGLTEKPLKEGDVVTLSEDEAEPYVGGVLSLVVEGFGASGTGTPENSYSKLKVEQLRELCGGLALDTTGTKAELIARLEAANQSAP